MRTFTNWCFFVCFKPTGNVQTYVNLRCDISLIHQHFSANCFFKLIIPPIKWRVLFEVKNLDPRDVYKRDHSIVDTHISLLSNSNKCIKPRSMFQCLRSSLRCVFLVTNQFDPAKKASSVMAASVSSTALAIWAYHSPNTETQLKPVHLSTGVV